jgi:hypothetical protein
LISESYGTPYKASFFETVSQVEVASPLEDGNQIDMFTLDKTDKELYFVKTGLKRMKIRNLNIIKIFESLVIILFPIS